LSFLHRKSSIFVVTYQPNDMSIINQSKWIGAATVMLALLSCQHSRQADIEIIEPPIEYIERVDTMDSLRQDSIAESPKASDTKASSSSSRPIYPTTRYKAPTNPNEDGMRGWDPASEDDMEDNGMTRYMENTDERGWM